MASNTKTRLSDMLKEIYFGYCNPEQEYIDLYGEETWEKLKKSGLGSVAVEVSEPVINTNLSDFVYSSNPFLKLIQSEQNGTQYIKVPIE